MAQLAGSALIPLILRFSSQYAIPPDIIYGVIVTESTYDSSRIRTEQYRYLVDVGTGAPFRRLMPNEITSSVAPNDFPHIAPCSRDTEWMSQRTSWGLMQVMGANLRTMGFKRPFLSEATDPTIGLDYGVRWLSYLKTRHHVGDDWTSLLSIYNAGSPCDKGRAYARKVLKASQLWSSYLESSGFNRDDVQRCGHTLPPATVQFSES